MTTPHETVTQPQVGQSAPTFKLPAHPAGTISLDDYLGKQNIILAFYPMDDTPGCTKEMCAFSSDLTDFEKLDTAVLGISCDSLESHKNFAGKFSLKQPLLSDQDGKVGRLYGTVREGKSTANRVLFVIDKKGIVRHIFEGMPTNAELIKVVEGLR